MLIECKNCNLSIFETIFDEIFGVEHNKIEFVQFRSLNQIYNLGILFVLIQITSLPNFIVVTKKMKEKT